MFVSQFQCLAISSTFCNILFSSTKKFRNCISLTRLKRITPHTHTHTQNITHSVVLVCVLEQLLNHPWVKGEKAKDDQMDPEIVSRLQSFNARRKLRAAAIASVWSSTVFLRTKKLKSLVGAHDLTEEEIENLRIHFKKM